MRPKSIAQTLIATLVIWGVPFACSLLFFDRQRQLLVPFWMFKLVMVVTLLITTSIVLKRLLLLHPQDAASRTWMGAFIAVGNVMLDTLTVIPLTQPSWPAYVVGTALMYTSIPLIARGLGGEAWEKAKLGTTN